MRTKFDENGQPWEQNPGDGTAVLAGFWIVPQGEQGTANARKCATDVYYRDKWIKGEEQYTYIGSDQCVRRVRSLLLESAAGPVPAGLKKACRRTRDLDYGLGMPD